MLVNDAMEMKSLYIVLSRTNTGIGRIIRMVNRCTYNHVSVSKNLPINKMYSFARYHKGTPLMGGFVVEYPYRFLLPDTQVKVFQLEFPTIRYQEILERLQDVVAHAEEYLFNTFSLITLLFHRFCPVPKAYGCMEFLIYLLDLPTITSMSQLDVYLEGIAQVVHVGSFRECMTEQSTLDDRLSEDYNRFPGMWETICGSLRHLKTLWKRRRAGK